MTSGPNEVDRLRASFFRRTRTIAVVMYIGLGATALVLAAIAIHQDVVNGLLAALGGLVAVAALFLLGTRVATGPGAAQWLIVVGAVAGVVLSNSSARLESIVGGGVIAGAFAGFMAGTVAGMALIRRRLRTDDELLLRQTKLGWMKWDK